MVKLSEIDEGYFDVSSSNIPPISTNRLQCGDRHQPMQQALQRVAREQRLHGVAARMRKVQGAPRRRCCMGDQASLVSAMT